MRCQSFISSKLFKLFFHLSGIPLNRFISSLFPHWYMDVWQNIYALFNNVHMVMHIFELSRKPLPHTGGYQEQSRNTAFFYWNAPLKQLEVAQGHFNTLKKGRTLLVYFRCHPPWLRYCLKMWHCRVLFPAECKMSLSGINWRVFGRRI